MKVNWLASLESHLRLVGWEGTIECQGQSISTNSRTILLKENRIKVLLKENGIPKIVNSTM